MSKGNSQTSSNTEPRSPYPGNPNCPVCGGVGFIRQDLPVGHPNFGRLVMCACLQAAAVNSEQARRLRMSNLEAFRDMTFDTFQVEGRMGLPEAQASTLRLGYNLSKAFAENLNGWLLIMGGYGCGKTHLAAAVANEAVDRGVETLFQTVPDLLDWLRASYASPDESFEQRFEELRAVQLLILDDLGTQNATPWAEEKLYQIINYRYINRMPTVVTTNLDMAEIDGRISSRLMDEPLVSRVRITAPDFRNPTKGEGRSLRTDLNLMAGYTFDSFTTREFEKLERDDVENLRKALKICQDYARSPSGWLVLSGGVFSGKTHLAAAIGNSQAQLGRQVSFWVVAELLDHLRSTFSPSSNIAYDRLFEEIKNAPLLILDDLGGHSSTPWAQEKLYQILNYRYNADLPTVITTLLSMDAIEPRLRSRMMDRTRCLFFGITAPAFVPGGGKAARPTGSERPRSSRSKS